MHCNTIPWQSQVCGNYFLVEFVRNLDLPFSIDRESLVDPTDRFRFACRSRY